MIKEVVTSKGVPAITSDQWYVVHSRLVDPRRERPYSRAIHSEHPDRVSCVKAAKTLRVKVASDGADVPAAERDEVWVCKPNFKLLKLARSRHSEVS
ncbi:MAG TPA: hypothetical protein VFZ65_12305 [Planctomycetota bacterium]|nr:hypothetical protein [Planctomycetota bacterium]